MADDLPEVFGGAEVGVRVFRVAVRLGPTVERLGDRAEAWEFFPVTSTLILAVSRSAAFLLRQAFMCRMPFSSRQSAWNFP